MYTAILRCGTVLAYEARSFVPSEGDVVPCRRHGFCAVCRADGNDGAASSRPLVRRSSQRSRQELIDFLRGRPVTTVHVLRRQRFTLRLITAAEREGILEADLGTGRVTLMPAPQ